MIDKKVFIKAFGLNEFGQVDFPRKISNVKLSRLEWGNEMGCSFCFPYGFETTNATIDKNTRSWKRNRKSQYKSKGAIPPF